MSHLPTIIADLSIILLVAGITTLLFKKLNQPLVLGYIVAGIITGPHFNFFPSVADQARIEIWAEIGVIFLMFALGLEFSFYKLKRVGSTACIATSIAIGGMVLLGYLAGMLLGWSHLNCLFLGCMLSMSSTAIVVKAFDDFGLKAERFAQIVFGMVIVEDIMGIIMLVVLPTLAVSSSGSDTDVLESVLRLAFFIILWFVLGIYLVPTFFKRVGSLLNDETMLVAALGLCLGMVVMVTRMGFSSALGAFLMGSLIAEAPDAERIEVLVKPVKDLFSAVFFVSVGMLVNPQLLLDYALPVAFLTLLTIVGKVSCSIVGVLATGHNLHTSVKVGFSLCQIGEFSFILANLGSTIGAIDSFLYPIVVAVSVITTFVTPFLIKASEKGYQLLKQLLPQRALIFIERYTEQASDEAEDSDWRNFLQAYLILLVVQITLLTAIALAAFYYLLPTLGKMQLPYSNYLAAGIAVLITSPILHVMLLRRTNNSELFSILWFKKRANHLPLTVLVLLKLAFTIGFLYFCFHRLAGLTHLVTIVVVLTAAFLIYRSGWLLGQYLRMESHFLVNLNEKHMQEHRQASGRNDNTWFDEDIHLKFYMVEKTSPLANKSLNQLDFRKNYSCNVLQIVRGDKVKSYIDLPDGMQRLKCGDSLLMIGSLPQLNMLDNAIAQANLGLCAAAEAISLRNYMLRSADYDASKRFRAVAVSIDQQSPLLHKAMRDLNIRANWNCMIIGLERGAYTITDPHVALVFEKGDLLWLLGKEKQIAKLSFSGKL